MFIAFFFIRVALLSCFPGIERLMCYFHAKQACQAKLQGKPMKDQKEILQDINEMHSAASQEEYSNLYCGM